MRIGILESVPVDARRRLVLVRRDDVEHLVMIGGPSEFVVETNIGRAGPRQLADNEPSAAGQRAIMEAADRHASPDTMPSLAAPERAGSTLPVNFTFDETELMEGLDLGADKNETPAAREAPAGRAEPPRRREPAPILSAPQVLPGAANDIRGMRDPIQRLRPTDGQLERPRDAERSGLQDWTRRGSGAPLKEKSEELDSGGMRHLERTRPGGGDERSRFSDTRRGPSLSRESSTSSELPEDHNKKRGPQITELPAARPLPSVTAESRADAGPGDEVDIENEIVRALGMDIPSDDVETAPPVQLPAVRQAAAGEPRTRLGDLADRLEEALAREVRSASQAKSRLDLDLDSFGFDRERGRTGSSPQRQDRPDSVRQDEPKAVSEMPAAEREKPTAPASELAEAAAKREARGRPERQDNPPVISLSARRREASDPLEDEMARLLGELTGDGGRR